MTEYTSLLLDMNDGAYSEYLTLWNETASMNTNFESSHYIIQNAMLFIFFQTQLQYGIHSYWTQHGVIKVSESLEFLFEYMGVGRRHGIKKSKNE